MVLHGWQHKTVSEEDIQLPLQGMAESDVLASILEGTASATGEEFFVALVRGLAEALNTQLAWVTEYVPDSDSLNVLSDWNRAGTRLSASYPLAGTPCEPVILGSKLVHVPDEFAAKYPQDLGLIRLGVCSYLGVPLLDLDGRVLGHLAVMDARPMPSEPRFLAVFRIFAARAAAELQRLRAEAELSEKEEKLRQLFAGAMDAIVELDESLRILMLNDAARDLLGLGSTTTVGESFERFLDGEGKNNLKALATGLLGSGESQRSLWIPGGLALGTGDQRIPAEATLSAFPSRNDTHYALIMRNVKDRLEAEQKILALSSEATYLKEEIRNLGNFGGILGSSPALQHVFNDLENVAVTDATVLVLGETGTGKELVARAIHDASLRADGILIKLNCAALPEHLVEAELFGHEKGAFTGANKKREGRFAIADGGTIFLDEIGDLPLSLQAKLLRVLQEGEFEPLGSSRTRKVDVRVIAATNQDLLQATEDGKFREDLYYRLAVFPITVPPLRDRLEDLDVLVKAFITTFAQRLGRKPVELRQVDTEQLAQYDWPGNIRELQNVIERALITSVDGYLNLDRALPKSTNRPETFQIRTMAELVEIERGVICSSLEECAWQVAGDKGAARLLGMNASTLNSRMKALNIKRPPKA